MDSIGRFIVEEVDGKRSFIYSPVIFSSEPTNDSDEADGFISQTLFLCPHARISSAIGKEDVSLQDFDPILKIDSSPRFHGVAQQMESADDYKRLDSYNHHVLPLFWCNNKQEEDWSQRCGACKGDSKVISDFYFCGKCDKRYHKECVESPCKINHPLHHKHPLQLCFDFNRSNLVKCFRCKSPTPLFGYQCTLCKFGMHPICVREPVSYVIDKCKRHHHPLTFFTRQASFLDCDVCGLISHDLPTYICLQCNFVAHRRCVDSPHVIRISRHQHRISFALSLPPGTQSCGVCRKEVKREYGGYTCNKCDDYVVHSRCALRRDVWDGEDLQGVPEEDDIEEVVDPFERISDGVILHFSHKHVMRLETTSRVYDESKICEACVIPIYEGDFYSCGECDFILHDKCANAPRRKIHPLHPHPLTLRVFDGNRSFEFDYLNLYGFNVGSGFIYECMKKGCWFKLDVRCASISEPLNYQGHQEHPLFFALDPRRGRHKCQVCQNSNSHLLNCIECDYIICLECVTLPYMVRYKHDKHFLTLGYGDETSKPDWCEVCEKKLTSSGRGDKRFYSCNHCCTTLHVKCLFGEDRYMKPGHTVINCKNTGPAAKILLNNSLSRPTCDKCKARCEDKIIYRWHNKTWCSFEHFKRFRHDTMSYPTYPF